jgi:hypothetical protein
MIYKVLSFVRVDIESGTVPLSATRSYKFLENMAHKTHREIAAINVVEICKS